MIGLERTGEASAKYIIAISAKNERYCFKKLNKLLQILFLSLFRQGGKVACSQKSGFNTL
jgi:hypothetical protein